jgi:predicted aconitase with swiveling domain
MEVAMDEIILKGHKVAKGKAEGEALVSQQPISFMYSVDPETGVVTEEGHDLEGMGITGKILVFPVGKGSSAGSYRLYEMLRCKTHPKGLINLRAEPVVATGAIFCDIPMVDQLDGNPLEMIRTGDYVEIDADQGIVKVRKRP